MAEPTRPEPRVESPELDDLRVRVDDVLERFLGDRRAELAGLDPRAADLVDELTRLLRAGGKRIRPALCFWAFAAAGGSSGEPILRVCAALELLHLSAIVHDDLIDRDDERRGVASTYVRFAKDAPTGVDPDGFGTASAVVVGDLALVLAELAMRTSGFPTDVQAEAVSRFDRMRLEMAAGQYLDVSGALDRARVSALKSASYTAEGPVLIGAALANASPPVEGPLRVFGRLIGEAFQLRDDVLDGEASSDAASRVDALVSRATHAIDDCGLRPDAVAALVRLAEALRLGSDP